MASEVFDLAEKPQAGPDTTTTIMLTALVTTTAVVRVMRRAVKLESIARTSSLRGKFWKCKYG
jgi:hypothetical protein